MLRPTALSVPGSYVAGNGFRLDVPFFLGLAVTSVSASSVTSPPSRSCGPNPTELARTQLYQLA